MLKYVIIKDNKYLTTINGIYPFWTTDKNKALVYNENEIEELIKKFNAQAERV